MGVDLHTILVGVTALITALTPIMLAVINRRQSRAVADASAKVESVRTDLKAQRAVRDEQIASIKETGEKVEKNVNSERTAMQAELRRMNALVLKKAEEHARELKALRDQLAARPESPS